MVDVERLKKAADEFKMPNSELKNMAEAFRYDIVSGFEQPLASTLRLLPSYTNLPDGFEEGCYLALDFGGTNLRILKIKLMGAGEYEVLSRVEKPLKVEGEYDYIGEGSSGEALWDFVASLIDEANGGDRSVEIKLGHTFSFPTEQTDIYNAKLITWTKEFRTQGVEGEIINDQLKAALERRGMTNVVPVAVINDTVAVLLSAAYENQKTFIGSILATGHNTCYLEDFNGQKAPMIINLESGNFSKIVPNKYDSILDAASQRPSEQRMEKMVSGKYLGELFTIALADALKVEKLVEPFTSVDLSEFILAEKSGAEILKKHTGEDFDAEGVFYARDLAEIVVRRSARIIAASFVGTLSHIMGVGLVIPQQIAIEGTVYAKMPVVREALTEALYDILGGDAARLEIKFITDGGTIGAAIAAAMTD